MKYSATTGGFYSPDINYPTLPADAVEISTEIYEELVAGQSADWRIEPDGNGIPRLVAVPPPTPEQVIAARRANATIDRGPLCKALLAEGILPAASAILAAKGDWPPEFAGFLSALPADAQIDAQIDWADASRIRYASPLLQTVALAYAGTAEAATALLDQLLGIGAE